MANFTGRGGLGNGGTPAYERHTWSEPEQAGGTRRPPGWPEMTKEYARTVGRPTPGWDAWARQQAERKEQPATP